MLNSQNQILGIKVSLKFAISINLKTVLTCLQSSQSLPIFMALPYFQKHLQNRKVGRGTQSIGMTQTKAKGLINIRITPMTLACLK